MAGQERMPSAAGAAAQRPVVVSCWMCGIRLQQDQMVPDGGEACSDIRWYCDDTWACTERWTSARRQAPAAEAPSGRSAIAALYPDNQDGRSRRTSAAVPEARDAL
jgi:hypothetical protein